MVGTIHKKMSRYVHTLVLIGTLFGFTIIYPASSLDTPKSEVGTHAQALMASICEIYLGELLRDAEYLHQVLNLQPKALSEAIQKIADPKEQTRVKLICSNLATTVESVRLRCLGLLNKTSNDEMWTVTAGLIRLYAATHNGLQHNFTPNTSDAEPTANDSTALNTLKALEAAGTSYEEKVNRAFAGDKTMLKDLLRGFMPEQEATNILDRASFSIEQQVVLKKILLASRTLQQKKAAIDKSIKCFGLTWREKQHRWLGEGITTLNLSLAMSPATRVFTAGGTITTLALLSTAFDVFYFGYPLSAVAAKAFAAIGTGIGTIGAYTLVGTGQEAGRYLTQKVVETVGDGVNGIIEWNGKSGKIGEYENRIGGTKNGCIIKKIIPHESQYTDATIGNKCDKPIALFDDMLIGFGQSGGEAGLSLKDRKKTTIYSGPTGAGKTFFTDYIMNECAKKARRLGVEVYEVFLPPKSIELNEMDAVFDWAHDKKAIIFFNFDEFQHSKPSQGENSQAYGNLLNFFQKLTQCGKPYIGLGTTNQPELASDLIRRVDVIPVDYPVWKTRKEFFSAKCSSTLYSTYDTPTLNRFATLAQGASMSKLQEIISNLKAKKTRMTHVTVQDIESEILEIVHGIQQAVPQPIQQLLPQKALAAHFAGKLIISLTAANANDFIEGTSISIASTAHCLKRDNPNALKETSYTGQFIWSSAERENSDDHQKLKVLIAGYVAQELLIPNPQQRNTALIKKDRLEATKLLLQMASDDPEQMHAQQKDAFLKALEADRSKIEAEVREEFRKMPTNLLHKTVGYITDHGQMTALEFFALRKKLSTNAAKESEDDESVPQHTGKSPHASPTKPQAHAAAAHQRSRN
jgi:hypothetical protein